MFIALSYVYARAAVLLINNYGPRGRTTPTKSEPRSVTTETRLLPLDFFICYYQPYNHS